MTRRPGLASFEILEQTAFYSRWFPASGPESQQDFGIKDRDEDDFNFGLANDSCICSVLLALTVIEIVRVR